MATQRMHNAQVRIAAEDVICANVRYFLAFVVANSQRAKAFATESTESALAIPRTQSKQQKQKPMGNERTTKQRTSAAAVAVKSTKQQINTNTHTHKQTCRFMQAHTHAHVSSSIGIKLHLPFGQSANGMLYYNNNNSIAFCALKKKTARTTGEYTATSR